METPPILQPSADDSFRMIDVGEKNVTRRRAVAEGSIRMSPETCKRIFQKAVPKGDVLRLAEVAGIMAAKKASDLLPLCHPLPIDAVYVNCEAAGLDTIRVTCEAITHSKTGVEMEALTGASIALLAIYDLVKGIDSTLSVSNVFLRSKEGGKSDFRANIKPPQSELQNIKCAILTVSDRCSRGETSDESGRAILAFFESRQSQVVASQIVADEKQAIQSALRQMVFETGAELILCTGGTGLAPRDITPEAFSELCTKPIPGIGELLRASGARHTEMSWVSRSEAGLIGKALVILLPGSTKAVCQGLEALETILPHALHITRGGDHA